MPELLPALGPTELAALLKKVDEVCEQAKSLRTEIVTAMQRYRADDRRVKSSETFTVRPPSRRTRKGR